MSRIFEWIAGILAALIDRLRSSGSAEEKRRQAEHNLRMKERRKYVDEDINALPTDDIRERLRRDWTSGE